MLQNYFELKQGGKTVCRRNSINNPFVFYKEKRVMCSYIYIKYGDGSYVFKTPVLRDFNFDCEKGGLYACYETSLAADELNGATIQAVGFSASQSELTIVNTCAVGMTKEAGEPLYIGGTMALNAFGGNFALFAGDNKLVRMLLGTEIFSAADMSITCGVNNTPIEGYTYTAAVLPSSVNPVFGEKEISISKEFYLPATDIVLLAGGSPVLRVMAALPETEETKFVSAPQNDFITVSVSDKVTGIKDLKVVTLPVSFTQTRIPSGLNYKKTAKVKLPPSFKIVRNAAGEHFGYVAERRAATFALKNGELAIKRFFAAKDIFFADDGAVFIVADDGAVSFAGADDAPIDSGPVALGITVENKYAAAGSGGEYVLAAYKGGRAVFYKITLSAQGGLPLVSVLSDTKSEADTAFVHVFALPGCVSIKGIATPALCFGIDGALTPQKLWLDAIADVSWFINGAFPLYDGGKLILYNPYIDQSSYYVYMKNTRYSPSGYGRFFGEFCIRNRVSSTDASAIGGVSPFISAAGRAAYAVTSGRFLYLFLENGQILAYYIASQSSRLTAGAITQGQTVSYTQCSVSPPAMGALTLKIKLEE